MDRKKLRERVARFTPYLLALLTAVLLRIFVDNFNDTGRRFDIPLTVRNLKPGCVVAAGLPSTVSVKLVGYKNALEDPGIENKLSAWVDLGRAEAGTNALTVKVGNANLPFNVNLGSVAPIRIKVLIECPTNGPGRP